MDFNIEDLTVGEVEFLEEYLDRPLTALMDEEDGKKGTILKALALVMVRRTNPLATEEDAKAIPLKALMAALSGTEQTNQGN